MPFHETAESNSLLRQNKLGVHPPPCSGFKQNNLRMKTIATPAIYKIFSPGRKQSTASLGIISDTVIHDCSGAYDYIDLMLQGHQFSKSASIFAIAEKGGKEFQLKPLPEY
jgi:hypothetical protein